MKTTVFFITMLFVTSCSPYPKGLHDDCRTYLKEFRAQWKRLPNGFYAIDNLTAPPKSKVFTNAYLFDQEWSKYEDCLFQLSPKEIQVIFGKPSKIEKGKNEIQKFEFIAYYYFIRDTACNPNMEYPYVSGAYAYNRLTFVFYNGKQSNLRPRLELPCEKF
jgi:hypothetical protein